MVFILVLYFAYSFENISNSDIQSSSASGFFHNIFQFDNKTNAQTIKPSKCWFFTCKNTAANLQTNSSPTQTTNNPIVNNTSTNHAPLVTSSPVLTVNSGQTYFYQMTATEADNDNLIYSFQIHPAWLLIDSLGKITGNAPVVSANTNYNVNISVSDGKMTVYQAYILKVSSVTSSFGTIPPPPSLPS